MGNSEIMFYLENYKVFFEGVLHSLINRLELHEHVHKQAQKLSKRKNFCYSIPFLLQIDNFSRQKSANTSHKSQLEINCICIEKYQTSHKNV